MGTTPIPAIATVASTGEATNSLCHHLQGTGYLATCSQHLCHHLRMSHRRWQWRRGTQEWGPMALPIGIFMTIITMVLRVMARFDTSAPVIRPNAPTTGPQVHL
jgi:hypothetical protein